MNDQVLLRLISQVQQLNERVQKLEATAAQGFDVDPSVPNQEDLLEVQLHGARVAAELSRVTVELRSEIANAARGIGDLEPDIDDADSADDAEIIDLTANHPSGRRRSSGWIPDPVAHNRRHTDPK